MRGYILPVLCLMVKIMPDLGRVFLQCFDTVGYGDRKGIRPVKLGVGLQVMTI